MAQWIEKIELNGVLGKAGEKFDLSRAEEDCPDEVKNDLAAEVAKSIWLSRFSGRLRGARSIAEVNRILEQVFDEADRHRVWCGLPSYG